MNREIFPNSLWPITGDVSSEAGNNKVRVIGLNGVSLDTSTIMIGGEMPLFDVVTGKWMLRAIASIQVNGLAVSFDSNVSVNVLKPLTINGA